MILAATSSLLAIPFSRRCRFAPAEPFAHAELDPQDSFAAAEKNISLFAGRVGARIWRHHRSNSAIRAQRPACSKGSLAPCLFKSAIHATKLRDINARASP